MNYESASKSCAGGGGYYERCRVEILPLVPPGMETVLDIGCGNGATSAMLKERGLCKTAIGVESDCAAAKVAETRLERVLGSDVEGMDLDVVPGSIDLLLCLDVLEHLVNPWRTLEYLAKLVRPGGHVIASVPNVRNYRVVLPLVLLGHWSYREEGVLDRTHLRFFTRESALCMIQGAGFQVEETRHTGASRGSPTWWATIGSLGLLGRFMELQYLIRGRKV